MASKTFCDRCGEEIGNFAESATLTYKRNGGLLPVSEAVDLCVECYLKLLDWLNGGGNVVD